MIPWIEHSPAATENLYLLVFGSLLLISVAIFTLIDRKIGFHKHPKDRRTDWTHFTIDLLFLGPLFQYVVSIISVYFFIRLLDGVPSEVEFISNLLNQLPIVAKVIFVLLFMDILQYSYHRLVHSRWLWKLHATHHLSTTVNWLSSARLHPINNFMIYLYQAIGLTMVGLSPQEIQYFLSATIFIGFLNHTHLKWDYGPLRNFVASPSYHRWHHAMSREKRPCNLAHLFPVLDIIFGTYYFPKGEHPSELGYKKFRKPTTYWQHLVFPFSQNNPEKFSS